MNNLDKLIVGLDKALRVMTDGVTSVRPTPATGVEEGVLDEAARRHSAGLMRVNHVGEVCAQALYAAQGQFAKNTSIQQQFVMAGREEEDHLSWTSQRLAELGSQPSLLNPLWYAGAYLFGMAAAQLGDKRSLGIVVETEQQVEAHLHSHLVKLPLHDAKSRAIVTQMHIDEIAHGATAKALGAVEASLPVRIMMQAMAKIMTTTAYYL
jgi:3-demethoxyubiquinol 3-hydroxylase